MSRMRRDVAVGAFVISSFALLLFGVYFLKELRPGQKFLLYTVEFPQVSTLQDGDPVKVNGVKSGKVIGIALTDRGVQVRLKVDGRVRIPIDSDIRIQNIGLMGERQMGIQLGKSTEIALESTPLHGVVDAGIAEAMGIAGEVFIESQSLVLSMRTMLDSTLLRPDFAPKINGLIDTLDRLSKRVGSLLKDGEPSIRRSLAHFDAAGKVALDLMQSQKEPVARLVGEGADAAARAKILMVRADAIAARFDNLLARIDTGNGTLGALMRDSTLHRDLRAALTSADSLFQQIDRKGLDVNLNLF